MVEARIVLKAIEVTYKGVVEQVEVGVIDMIGIRLKKVED